jgi:hypothetical protein
MLLHGQVLLSLKEPGPHVVLARHRKVRLAQ